LPFLSVIYYFLGTNPPTSKVDKVLANSGLLLIFLILS